MRCAVRSSAPCSLLISSRTWGALRPATGPPRPSGPSSPGRWPAGGLERRRRPAASCDEAREADDERDRRDALRDEVAVAPVGASVHLVMLRHAGTPRTASIAAAFKSSPAAPVQPAGCSRDEEPARRSDEDLCLPGCPSKPPVRGGGAAAMEWRDAFGSLPASGRLLLRSPIAKASEAATVKLPVLPDRRIPLQSPCGAARDPAPGALRR